MRKKQFVVGLTGGIASGKSSAAGLFSNFGIPSVDLDDVSRIVVQPKKPALSAIAERFGNTILQQDGSLDRAQLRHVIFNDTKAKQWVEALLHPIIRQEAFQQVSQLTAAPYVLLVAPLLYETDLHQKVDHVIVIDTNETQQIIRVTNRDQISAEAAKIIMNQQMPRHLRLSKANSILENTGGLEALKSSVFQLHKKLCTLASHHKKSTTQRAT